MNNYQMTDAEQIQTTQIYNEAQKGKNYLESLGLIRKIPLWVDFYEGKQWSDKISKDTRHIPRLVFNVTRKICDSKITNILGKSYKMNFRTPTITESTQKFNAFVEYNLANLDQARLDYELVKSGVVKGTYVGYYYYNKKAIGQSGRFEGAICGESVDPLKTYVADPSEKDIQKQEYIIFEHKESVKSVRNLCDKKAKRSLIVADANSDSGNYYGNVEDSDDLTIVYTKFFRIDDEVYYQNATKYVVLSEPIPFNPDLKYKKSKTENAKLMEKEAQELDGKEKGEIIADGKRLSIPDGVYEKNDTTNDNKCVFYPIIMGSFIDREGSIYGISEIEGIKEVQKAINYLNTYSVMSVQKQGIPKMVVKKDALKGQTPDNSIDQYLVDNTPNGVDGIKYLQVTPFTQGVLQLSPQLMEMVRDVTNANEIYSSDMIGKELSGTAISLLTANSEKTTDIQRKKYWRSLKQVGRILEQFMKHFYASPFVFNVGITDRAKEILQEADKEQYIQAKQNKMDYQPTQYNNLMEKTFTSGEYQNVKFDLAIEMGEGSQYSEAQSMYMLNNMLQAGMIDQKLYIKLYPAHAMSFKGDLLEELEKREQEEVVVLRQKTQEYEQQLQQLSNYVKQQETTIRQLQTDNNNTLQRMKAMQNEYGSKITQAREILVKQQDAINQMQLKKQENFAKEQNKALSVK